MKKTKFETDIVNLLERAINKQNLYEAYKRVKRNKGSHGIDGMCVDELDKKLEKWGHKFARYADDYNIFVKSKRAGGRVLENITMFL